MEEKKPKVYYLDGIRGIAAIVVLIHHFTLAFYLAIYNRESANLRFGNTEMDFASSVFSVFTNGNFAVSVFFVLSGFVLSRKYFSDNNIETLVSSAGRRFLRLYIPIAASLIVAYIILKLGLFYNQQAATLTKMDWWFPWLWKLDNPDQVFLNSMLYRVMFLGDCSFNTVLWSMSYEFFGSMLVFTWLALTHRTRNKALPMIGVCLFFFGTEQYAYMSFMTGICLNYLDRQKRITNGAVLFIASAVLMICGLVFGSYPTNDYLDGTMFASLPGWALQYKHWFHPLGALMLVAAVVISPRMQAFFSLRLCRFLGNISFSVYLLHVIVLASAGAYTFIHLYPTMGYNGAGLSALAVTLSITILAAVVMTKYVDKNGIRFSAWFYNKYLKRKG